LPCPDEETLLAFLDGRLAGAALSRMDAHLGSCASCRQLVADVAPIVLTVAGPATEASPSKPGAGALARGSNLGRYVLLDLVGRGGMGEVYGAYDPELDRKVALKLLHEDAGRGGSADRARARLLREAKAIARLSHPNVVVVHDAGTTGDRVFIAMEFVEGATLAEWLEETPRTWRDVREAYVAAGRGLEAAHAAGIVHRDFKPQNVMMSAGGVVRVMDFGLANDVGRSNPTEEDAVADAGPAAVALTRTGALLGTPAYMAPEQFRGEQADARTDQFSFCVALYEALYRQRPFPSDSLASLIDAVTAGRVREPAQRAGAPSSVRKAILRGLRPNPDERWPSMTALLAALERDPERRRRRILAASALAALLLGGGAVAQRMMGQTGAALCQGGGAKLAGVWAPKAIPPSARREAARAAFLATGLSFAADTWDRVAVLLDRYAERWTSAYAEACQATRVRAEQSAEVLDLRMDCLNRNLRELHALTDLFVGADREVVMSAVSAASNLGDLARCDDVAALRAVVPPPRDAETRARVEVLRGRVAAMKALVETGKDPAALSLGQGLLPELRQLGYDPLLADALLLLGYSHRNVGAAAASERDFEEAVTRALASRYDEGAVDAISLLAGTLSFDFGRGVDADRWVRLAEAILTRLGSGHDRARAWLEQARGNLELIQGRPRDAAGAFSSAVVLKEKARGRDHVDVAISLDSLALTLVETGELQKALAVNERALAIATAAFGDRSPGLGQYLSNRGEALNALGRPADALPLFRRALEVWGPLGADSPVLAYPLTGLGRALILEGRAGEAIAPLNRALALRVAAKDARVRLGETRFALARALWDAGGDRKRAHALGTAARDDFASPPARPEKTREIDGWLERHPAKG
jgi:tetratricopeptide (TPR) repeat protein/predicted Ser/Thr protein kinase